jgi:hypothetical protein
MLRIVFVTALLSLPLSAGAQTYSRTQTTIGGYSHQTLVTDRSSLGSQPPLTRSVFSPNPRQCLTRKKTGKTECHSYAEWAEIARAIDANRK